MPSGVFVTGIGMISAIGNNVAECYDSLINMRHGLSDIELKDTAYKSVFPFGEVKYSNKELADMAEISNFERVSRTSLLGLVAARETQINAAIKNSGRSGFISGTTVGGMDKSEVFYEDFILDPAKGKPEDILTHDCADSSKFIARKIGAENFVSTVSSACSSSLNSIIMGMRMIKCGMLDYVIAGGSDSLTKFTVNGFNSLMILDSNHCRPFDKNRAGLNLGEGAAYLVLESEKSVVKHNSNPICEIRGWGNACDAFHQTASSPDGNGAYSAMKQSLHRANINPNEIDYINAHGTGTQSNDQSEATAIGRIFGSNIPQHSSTKPYTGHTLGAAGAIESIISILAIKHDIIFPNMNFTKQDDDINFKPATELISGNVINNVMTNSFGFGGNCSTLIFSKSSRAIKL